MASYAITVVGRDRPGIIAAITEAVAAIGGNLEDSSMTLLRGHFAWMLVADLNAGRAEVEAAVAHLRAPDLMVSVLPLPADEGAAGGPSTSHLLIVRGADHPGIVAGVTRLIADAGGNITDLSTRLAGDLYVLIAEVDLPAGTAVEQLSADLERTGQELSVDVTLKPAEADVL